MHTFEAKAGVSHSEFQQLLTGHRDYYLLEEKHNNLKDQLRTLGGLIHKQFDSLRGQGIKFEHDNELRRLLDAENLHIR